MNKRTSIIVIAILLMIIGAGFFAIAQDESTPIKQSINDSKTNASDETHDINSTEQTGKYVEYSDDIVANTTGTKILFFYAPWCPQCRQLEEDIKKSGLPENVTVIKVDYDSMQTLRQKYGVPLQTTLVLVDDQGNLVEKFVAYDDPSVQALKDNLL